MPRTPSTPIAPSRRRRHSTPGRARRLESTILGAAVFATGASLAGCGIILGLTDHELFPDEDATVTFDAGGAAADGAAEGTDGSIEPLEGSAEFVDSAIPADGSQPQDGGFGGFADVAPPCPWTPCAVGKTCCYGAGGDNCESACGFGSFPLVCTGADQCDAGACCANLQAVAGTGGRGSTGSAPRCDGWAFQGSACGSCEASTPTQCGATFALRMCASAADCPTAQPNCCHVTENNPFTYCVDNALSMTPSTCLPP